MWLLLVGLNEKLFNFLTKFEIFFILLPFANVVACHCKARKITEGYFFSSFLFSDYCDGNKILRIIQSFQLYNGAISFASCSSSPSSLSRVAWILHLLQHL